MFLADIEAEMVRKYLCGISTTEIASEYGTYKNAIRRVLLAHGVERRVQSGANAWNWNPDPPSYGRLHTRLRSKLNADECDMCGTTDAEKYVNACVNPTRWVVSAGSLMLVGDDVSDYRRMCSSCSFAYDARINREALAMYFGVMLP
jgi:hypothetical protein